MRNITLTNEEFTALGQAISAMHKPATEWARENKLEVMHKLLGIMDKFLAAERIEETPEVENDTEDIENELKELSKEK